MNWVEIIIHTTTAGADSVSDLLMEYQASGTMIEDRADIPDPGKPHGIWEIIDPKLLDTMPEDVLVHAWLAPDENLAEILDEIRFRLDEIRTLRPECGSLMLETKSVADENWSQVWKRYYKPFHIGERLVIKPTWEDYAPDPGDRVIEMDPGMAFGSGTHETTAMCVSLLEQSVRPGDRVIDVGTGSGILAIAAAFCGAGRVLAVDIDPDAVRVAKENIQHNRVEHQVTVIQGDLLTDVSDQCDICVANIISDIIISFADALLVHIRPGGTLICSGIVRERSGEVQAALEKAGFVRIQPYYRGEWTAFLAGRPD